ncbi:carboxymuconolactone decarboxylase family protein [uncultured Roseobacter sp.]|uniref:carboxymuconolactone decarboxylase family protein n=1 Tax=uncultured Roseobacter sp. TaxID=114847 RepID=UPI00260FD2FE|nr:carboxymuconolactone decarboxylase family protein [uncultured Roseobacter sp.]
MSKPPLISVELKTPDTAEGAAAGILAGARDQLGFVPNMYAAMANLPAVLENYTATYAAFREMAGFTPAEQETVFLTISQANGCHYCIAAHSMLADMMSGVPKDALDALRKGDAPADSRLGALSEFTRKMTLMRGTVEKDDVDRFLAAGFTNQHVFGVILAIACKTFSNYANHLVGTEVDTAMAAYALSDGDQAESAA